MTELVKGTVKRSNDESPRYDITTAKTGEWAIIFISERGGILAILSDYGNWSYTWSHHGRESFRHFLVELGRDTDYLMKKLGGGVNWYDAAATERAISTAIDLALVQGEISKETAQAAREHVKHCDFHDVGAAYRLWDEEESIADVFGEDFDAVPVVKDYEPGLRQFTERLWPLFVAAIQTELANEPNQEAQDDPRRTPGQAAGSTPHGQAGDP